MRSGPSRTRSAESGVGTFTNPHADSLPNHECRINPTQIPESSRVRRGDDSREGPRVLLHVTGCYCVLRFWFQPRNMRDTRRALPPKKWTHVLGPYCLSLRPKNRCRLFWGKGSNHQKTSTGPGGQGVRQSVTDNCRRMVRQIFLSPYSLVPLTLRAAFTREGAS